VDKGNQTRGGMRRGCRELYRKPPEMTSPSLASSLPVGGRTWWVPILSSYIPCRDNYASYMQSKRSQALMPPGGLRPAQLGVLLLGRVILGHVSATLVDLDQRGLLGMDELSSSSGPDWLLRDMREQAGSGEALAFELALLDGLFARQPEVRLSEIGEVLIPAVNQFRAQLRRDTVRRGWLRRWDGGKRTRRGEELLRRIHDFRREMRMLAAGGDFEGLTALAPYAMIFGLLASPISLIGAAEAGRNRPRESEVQWSQYDRFAQSWLAVCAGLPVVSRRASRSAPSQLADSVHEWSAPRGRRGQGHDSGHGGHTSGYGSHDGGNHTGGFSQAGHTGH